MTDARRPQNEMDESASPVPAVAPGTAPLTKSWNQHGFWQWTCGCTQMQDGYELCARHRPGGYTSLLAEHAQQAVAPGIAPREPLPEWRCFHCDEVFTDKAEAKEHFGEYLDDQQSEQRERDARKELRDLKAALVALRDQWLSTFPATALKSTDDYYAGQANGTLKCADALTQAAGLETA